MKLRWQDEVKLLSNMMYKPEKERWERRNKIEIGFYHWGLYLSKYAELRRKEIHNENSYEDAIARMRRVHPTIWAIAMNDYKREQNHEFL